MKLSTVMENKPTKKETVSCLKEHIKTIWVSWVKEEIRRMELLESVSEFVRASCPEAVNLDVIESFKVWYEREFELQERRKKDKVATEAKTDAES